MLLDPGPRYNFLGRTDPVSTHFFCHGYVSYHNLMRVILDVISISLSIAWSLPFFTTFFWYKVKPQIVCVYAFHPTGWGPQSSSRSETPEKSGWILWFMVDITWYNYSLWGLKINDFTGKRTIPYLAARTRTRVQVAVDLPRTTWMNPMAWRKTWWSWTKRIWQSNLGI